MQPIYSELFNLIFNHVFYKLVVWYNKTHLQK